jgi:3-oxoacyl-[acyl-carrier protein] reductase
MDLGITGRKAVVCASSRGLGLACATALAREGAQVWINGRNAGRLDEAAARHPDGNRRAGEPGCG